MIAEATWQVILKHGMKGATVRNIAKKAQLSLGALRHYFSTQEDLYLFAMNLVMERVRKRMEKIIDENLPLKEKIVSFLEQLLPMDDQSKAEMEVWFHFTYHYYQKGEAGDDGIRNAVNLVISYLDQHQLLKEGLDKEMEAERLYALIDGMALHRILDKNRPANEMMHRILTKHIEMLLKQ